MDAHKHPNPDWRRRRATISMKQNSIAERRLPVGTPVERLLPFVAMKSGRSISTHITKSGDSSLSHIPDTAASPCPSPGSSVNVINSSEALDMPSLNSLSEDVTRLAELANAKLERQSRRITDNDPTVPIHKSKKSRMPRSTKSWLPLIYADSTDDATSTANTSQRDSPLDVHAKVFLPRSRESSLSRNCESFRKDSACVSADEEDFQLVTGKRLKQAPKRTLGLNAHEVKSHEEPSSISAPFDKDEISNVFSNALPPLEYFDIHTGTSHGEVRFALQATGDITAQQWNADTFAWGNIGAFSNIRKRVEGGLASHTLKGETELHSLQRHTLAYFRAVALQKEATSAGRPFGPKELQAAMPNIPMDRNLRKIPTAAKPISTDVFSHGSVDDYEHDFDNSTDSEDQGWGHAYQNHYGASSRLLPQTYMSTHDVQSAAMESDPATTDSHQTPPKSLTVLNNLSFGMFPASEKRTVTDEGFRFPTLDACTDSSEVNRYTKAFCTPTNFLQAFQPRGQAELLSSEKAQQQTSSVSQADAVARREQMKASLKRIAENAVPRMRGGNAAARTVLHDPLHNQPLGGEPCTPVRPAIPRQLESENLIAVGSKSASTTHKSLLSAKSALDEPNNDLRDSEPDFTWKERPAEIYNVSLPPMTTEQLAAFSKPSPQNWNGPFFMGDPNAPKQASQTYSDKELQLWFHQGSLVAQRQEEFFQRIKTAHKTSPGPIGPPSANKKVEAENFNEMTTRLLVPVLENLSQYVQGPKEKRHGYFAPFAPPPEWCIDKGPNGNKSFFGGEDWGQLPERIGRDARYRPLPFEYGGSGGGLQSPFSSSSNSSKHRYMKF